MATRWEAADGHLNAGNSGFSGDGGPDKMFLSRSDAGATDTPPSSSDEQSILAIFEDGAAAAEGTSGAEVEEERELLLSALTEMLDRVEDDGAALSPFDLLPDTELLTSSKQQQQRCHSAERSPAHRLRPRPKPKPPKVKLKDGVRRSPRKQTQTPLCSRVEKAAEVDAQVFSSTSLVSLVRLMHPYCLRLRVEGAGGPQDKHPLFSQEEVWRFEQPAEGSDEEIDVVSDEESRGGDRGEEAKRGEEAVLRSALLPQANPGGSVPPRKKKRVSFGPVQVALFDQSAEEEEASLELGSETTPQKTLETPQSPAEAAPNKALWQTGEKSEAQGRTGEPKSRALSLQQYRQLRQERRPPQDKQQSYSTRWPSLPEPPTGLTPILCFQPNLPVRSPDPPPPDHPPTPSQQTPRPEPRVVSPTGPDTSRAKSPLKKPKLLCTDPPNPVLLPLLPGPHVTPVPAPSESETPKSSQQKPNMSSPKKDAHRPSADTNLQETEVRSSAPMAATGHESGSEQRVDAAEGEPGHEPAVAREKPTVTSGIEASDLSSLLQQFEQTQAGEKSPPVPKPLQNLRTKEHLDSAAPVETAFKSAPGPLLELLGPPTPEDSLQDVPEPLSTEVILSSAPLSRSKAPTSKLIQIIEPRRIPPKRTQPSPLQPPATCASAFVSSDHDYCGSLDPEEEEEAAAVCGLPTPPPSPVRGREKRRRRQQQRRTLRSDSSSSSCSSSSSSSSSRSPKRPRVRPRVSRSPFRSRHSRSRSRSRSWSWSRSRSHSRSRSRSLSRSPSPQFHRGRWRDICSSSRDARRIQRDNDSRIQKLRAIDERRVVYVGRIRRTMTHDELRERFSQFGEVECVSLHFRDRGDHYGFVTFYNTGDAFAAIDNGIKLRRPDELPFDICFGGRRQFCSSDYADLDANRDAELSPPHRNDFEDLDFDSLLKQAQRGLKR